MRHVKLQTCQKICAGAGCSNAHTIKANSRADCISMSFIYCLPSLISWTFLDSKPTNNFCVLLLVARRKRFSLIDNEDYANFAAWTMAWNLSRTREDDKFRHAMWQTSLNLDVLKKKKRRENVFRWIYCHHVHWLIHLIFINNAVVTLVSISAPAALIIWRNLAVLRSNKSKPSAGAHQEKGDKLLPCDLCAHVMWQSTRFTHHNSHICIRYPPESAAAPFEWEVNAKTERFNL